MLMTRDCVKAALAARRQQKNHASNLFAAANYTGLRSIAESGHVVQQQIRRLEAELRLALKYGCRHA